MKLNQNIKLAAMLAGACLVPSSASAAVYTFPDFSRPAAGGSVTETFDFIDATTGLPEGWIGSPPNNTNSSTTPIYLTATVSWTATDSNIGTFNVRFNANDNAGAPRIGMGKTGGAGTGFEFITGNGVTDPDGDGPATARPTIQPVDTSLVTTVTLVMKVDHSKAGTSPGGDWWFATEGLQSSAVGFMWINPNLDAPEESQFTPWAAWRSGNAGYQGVSFITNTGAVDLNFSNIALYTNGDTPFIPEPSVALLGGLGLLGLLRRRRH